MNLKRIQVNFVFTHNFYIKTGNYYFFFFLLYVFFLQNKIQNEIFHNYYFEKKKQQKTKKTLYITLFIDSLYEHEVHFGLSLISKSKTIGSCLLQPIMTHMVKCYDP